MVFLRFESTSGSRRAARARRHADRQRSRAGFGARQRIFVSCSPRFG